MDEIDKRIEALRREGGVLEDAEYMECVFSKCAFSNLTMRNIIFSNCVFEDCTLKNVTFQECSMLNGAFLRCALMGLDWTAMRRHGTRLVMLEKMHSCAIKYNTFVNMKMGKMDFSGSMLHDCFFQDCALKQADFRRCDLQDTAFQNCDLKSADFRDAKNYRINVMNNMVTKAKFSLPDALGLLSGLDIVIEQ